MEMSDTVYLRKHLAGFKADNSNEYVTGKYTGCSKTLVEGYMAVTQSSFIRISTHMKGASKRYKAGNPTKSSIFFSQTNSLIPIPFNGYPFEVVATERWNCNHTLIGQKINESSQTRRKRKTEDTECTASIQIRTVRIFTEFGIHDYAKLSDAELKKKKDVVKDNLIKALHTNQNVNFTEIHYCRFPLSNAHRHDKNDQRTGTTQLDKRVTNKIRELAKSGIYDVEGIKSMISDYVHNTLFAHADQEEKPKSDNKRYFPSTKAIRNHIFLAVGSVRNIPGYSENRKMKHDRELSPPSVTNVMEIPEKHARLDADQKTRQQNAFNVGFIAVHAGAGFHSDERWPGYKHLCSMVCQEITKLLQNGMPAGEAVMRAVALLEDSEMTNAGYGSNLTESGKVECDASVMDTAPCTGPGAHCDSYFGSVACVSKIRNPVKAAYRILDERRKHRKLELGRISPIFMVSDGAENWSRAHSIEMCLQDDLISESAYKTWQKYHQKLLVKLANHEHSSSDDNSDRDDNLGQRLDTVGAVVLDLHGNTAAAVSSGGLILKLPGRVGQAAMYGCGCWAEASNGHKPAVAISTSGCGEQLITTMLAKKCAQNLQEQEQPYQALHDTLVNDFLNSTMLGQDCDKQAGLLCLHNAKDGNNSTVEVVWGHTTSSMVIGHMSTNDTSPNVVLSRLPDNASPGRSVTVGGSWIKVACEPLDATLPNSLVPDTELEPCSHKNNRHSLPDQQLPAVSVQVDIEDCPQNKMMENGVNSNSVICMDGAHDIVDDEISIMYVSPVNDGLLESDCEVVLSEEFNRKIDPDYEKEIEQRWQQRVAQNPRFFNGQKFRIHSIQHGPCSHSSSSKGESDDNVENKLTFNLGLTTYRDYMETNWSKEVKRLQEMGKDNFGDSQAYLGEPLGVAGIVITDDDKAVFQWRNSWLAESPNKWDVPGGHPEPVDAAKPTAEDGKKTVTMNDLQNHDILHETFHSQVKEVRDELNVPLENIGKPRLMGLIRNRLSAGRPVAYFVMRCHMTSDVILQCYNKGGAETDESTKLLFLPKQDVIHLQKDSSGLWSQMCPNGKAACTLYSILERRKMT